MGTTITEGINISVGMNINKATGNLKKLGTNADTTGKKMEGTFSKVDKSVGRLTTSLKGLLVGGVALFALQRVGAMFFDINRETEKLFASLKTVTGSVEAATSAFAGIEKFASETPFQVEQITTAFIRMKSLGLDPSEAALRSYGNTASAMGKDLMQFVEAVADATTNEFERLKEFGIKAKSEGENVSFTFQGITTTVKKSAEEINEFLTSIGENQFAGAMADQMNTINGIISNTQDNFSKIARTIGGEGGFNNAMKDGLILARDWTAELAKQPEKIVAITNAMVRVARFTGEVGLAFAAAKVGVFLWGKAAVIAAVETTSLKIAIRGLLASTGIGLIAVAAGLVAEFLIPWDKLLGSKESVDDLTKSVANFDSELKNLIDKKEQIAAILSFSGITPDLDAFNRLNELLDVLSDKTGKLRGPKPALETPDFDFDTTDLAGIMKEANVELFEQTQHLEAVDRLLNAALSTSNVQMENYERQEEITGDLESRWQKIRNSIANAKNAASGVTFEIQAMNVASTSLASIFDALIFKADSLASVMRRIVQNVISTGIELGIRAAIGGGVPSVPGLPGGGGAPGNPLGSGLTRPTTGGDTFNLTINNAPPIRDQNGLMDTLNRVVPKIMDDRNRKRRG